LVFARSQDENVDVGALLREIVTAAGGRGGGAKDLAQGGVPAGANLGELLDKSTERVHHF
jgi:alanyl-tRNA synthetase